MNIYYFEYSQGGELYKGTVWAPDERTAKAKVIEHGYVDEEDKVKIFPCIP